MPVLPGVFPSNVSKKLLMEAGDRRGEKKRKNAKKDTRQNFRTQFL